MRVQRSLFMAVAVVALSASFALAQRPADTPAGPADDADGRDAWYGSSYEQPTPLMIIQAKAKARAMARINRIETNKAFGISNSRPIANAAPMTGMYSAAWQMPGGRPWAWYTSARPYAYVLR